TAYSARAMGKLAVVMADEAESKFGPFDSATKFFTLYEGMSVMVLRCDDEWYKVRRSDGKVGWVRRDTVEII
ncbi:MAG: SH3 domain-containing protein, partial [Endomicrobiia bacterium]|nr:SH3 domain-containing protein [Endomicrobiia bacterium]